MRDVPNTIVPRTPVFGAKLLGFSDGYFLQEAVKGSKYEARHKKNAKQPRASVG